jgi:hypothetical protein
LKILCEPLSSRLKNITINIINYLKIKEGIQTSGQPKENNLALICETGVNTVINLAMHDSETAWTNEGEVVSKKKERIWTANETWPAFIEQNS